jgi:hypothetical protein
MNSLLQTTLDLLTFLSTIQLNPGFSGASTRIQTPELMLRDGRQSIASVSNVNDATNCGIGLGYKLQDHPHHPTANLAGTRF